MDGHLSKPLDIRRVYATIDGFLEKRRNGREARPASGRRRGGANVKKLIAQIMKFGVVGVIAFVIDYGLLALLTEAFGVNYLVSATVSFTVSRWCSTTWRPCATYSRHKEGMSRRREFVIFVVLSVIGLAINNRCMWAGVELLGVHYLIVKIVRHRRRHGVELRHPQDLPRRRRRAGRDTLGHRVAGAPGGSRRRAGGTAPTNRP